MRIVRVTDGNSETYGFVKDDKIAIKSEITELTVVPIPFNIKDFLFDGWYDEIKNKTDELQFRENISKYKLLAPIPDPNKIICLAFNYVDHAKEQGLQAPDDPALVIKPRTTLNHAKSDIICPDFVTQLDYEIELAVIIGKNCKNVSIDDASEMIFGYMIFNDVSARDIQNKDKQFTRGKGFDSFAPCGPWITTADEIQNPQDLKMTTKVNGEIRQNSSTNNMFIKIPEIMSPFCNVITLVIFAIISGILINILFVEEFCLISPLTFVVIFRS
jgi:2-keto-4-pentenoate hydratase/2-oxohepta-3-ene-1,7-dioic acid hydratase in catechol pathway